MFSNLALKSLEPGEHPCYGYEVYEEEEVNFGSGYETPFFEKEEVPAFTEEILEEFNGDRLCLQCSGVMGVDNMIGGIMFSWKEFLEIIILMFSFITGQIVHILKISKYDNDLLIGDWFRNNKLTFITTIFCGLGILETLMSQIAYPVNIVGWFTLF